MSDDNIDKVISMIEITEVLWDGNMNNVLLKKIIPQVLYDVMELIVSAYRILSHHGL